MQSNSIVLLYPICKNRLVYLFVFYAFPLWKETKLSQQYEIANIWIKSNLKITIGFPEYLDIIWYKSYKKYISQQSYVWGIKNYSFSLNSLPDLFINTSMKFAVGHKIWILVNLLTREFPPGLQYIKIYRFMSIVCLIYSFYEIIRNSNYFWILSNSAQGLIPGCI